MSHLSCSSQPVGMSDTVRTVCSGFTDTHFVGLAAGNGKAAKNAERVQAALRREFGAHHHLHRRAIGELAGIAGRDHTAFDRRFDLRDAFVPGVAAYAFVLGSGGFTGGLGTGVLVDDFHGRGQRHDFVIEFAGGARGKCAG